jgi:hypothetical protein
MTAFRVLLLVLAGSTLAASASAQRVTLPRERLTRLATDSAIRSPVAVVRAGGVDTLRATAAGLELQRGEFAVLEAIAGGREVAGPPAVPGISAEDTLALASAASFRTMPFVLVTPDATLSGEWVLQPIYKVVEPMRWEPDADHWSGSFFFALQDTVRPRESRPVDPAIPFALLGEAEVAPTEVDIAHTNLPLQRIRVLARDATDSVRVHVVPGSELAGRDLWIPVEPSLAVRTEPSRIQGWGIQTAKVIARVVGASVVEPVTASASATRGALDTARIEIDESGAGEVRLRSAGIGPDTVEVFIAGIGRARQVVEVVFPWVFLVAALLGGVFGGIGASAQRRKKGRASSWAMDAAKGAFAGLLAALAWYALGISLLQIDLGVARFNELAVFTLAALAAYFGIPKPGPAEA